MVVPVTTSPAFSAGVPMPLFEATAYAHSPSYRAYDVTPDDKRFIMLRAVTDSVAPPNSTLVVVDNWFEELKAKMGKE